ncbi:MAG: TetR/AcrR family transcriptional regulator [Myxococcales bacterium]|nr:TetR/AcrR family transcriptional regulator [Myxococcales bacterium]
MKRKPGRPARPIERGELLRLARAIFAEHGYGAASLSQLADRSGLRKASLYHHFPTKQSLYVEVLTEIVRDLSGLVAEAGLDAGDFVDRLDRLGGLVTGYLGHHPDAARLLLREMVSEGTFAAGEGAAAVQATLHAVAAFLDAGMQAGAFRRQDPKQLAMSIIGVHLVYFAAAAHVAPFVGGALDAPARIEERRGAVLEQVRALCV